jgi:diguanylate cyclase (GGDEF)-like protein
MGRHAPDAAPGRIRRLVRLALPDGGHLPPSVWRIRHRWILGLLWAHVPVIVAFGLIQGYPLPHLLFEVSPIVVLAVGAAKLTSQPRWSATVVAVGLATCSAVLVHLANGTIEMHFHFFVMVAVITLYQDWPPFLACIAYVIVHHSVFGTLAPESVFNHPAAIDHPLTWALIHGGFILAMRAVGLASWRLNEITRARVIDGEEKLAHAQEIAGLGSWEWHVPSGRLTWSQELYRLFGFEDNAFEPSYDAFLEHVHPDDRPIVQAAVAATYVSHDPFNFDFRAVLPDGSIRWMHSQGEVIAADGTEPTLLYGTAHDITGRKLAENDLQASQQASRLIQDVAVAANQASSLDHAMQTGLTAVCDYTGWPVGQVHLVRDDDDGLTPAGIWHVANRRYRSFRDVAVSSPVAPDDDLAGTVLRSRHPAWDPDIAAEDPLLRAAASDLGLHARCAVPVVAAHEVVAVLEFFSRTIEQPDEETMDLLENVGTQIGRVVERKRAQEALAHQAHHDPLTGLPNRSLFLDRLDHALSRLGRRSGRLAVLFMDLDGFKVINDSLGHDAGDRLLIGLAERLGDTVREADTVARFGGDEFAILCTDLDDETTAVLLAERIAEELAHPFPMEEEGEYVVSASIGIAVASPDLAPTTAADLLRDADLAMYRAKERGAGHAIFDTSMHAAANERLALGTALRRAVDSQEFRLHFQPQVALDGEGAVIGVEALVRWEHPERGLVPPGEFVPVAESTGLIVPIGSWVLQAACEQLGIWQRDGRPDLTMCVNVSARQLADPTIVGLVERVLDTTGVTPATLCLEITESVLMEDLDHVAATLDRLKALGVSLSVDDFGTGYSSLAYLRRLPADFLKIDKSFVDDLGTSDTAAAIVRTIVDLAHSLGLGVVAEGVETEVQADALTALGCDQAQGFLFARPAPAEVVSRRLGCRPAMSGRV